MKDNNKAVSELSSINELVATEAAKLASTKGNEHSQATKSTNLNDHSTGTSTSTTSSAHGSANDLKACNAATAAAEHEAEEEKNIEEELTLEYEVPYWENVICSMTYNKSHPEKSTFELKTSCGYIPLQMYMVGNYSDTGIGLD